MPDAVLDASAILAVIYEEPGADKVEAMLPGAAASSANIAEAMAKLLDNGMAADTAEDVINGLHLEIHDVDVGQAFENGRLRPLTREAGLSLGDRACLALAKQLGFPALTTDRPWSKVSSAVSAEIVVIR